MAPGMASVATSRTAIVNLLLALLDVQFVCKEFFEKHLGRIRPLHYQRYESYWGSKERETSNPVVPKSG